MARTADHEARRRQVVAGVRAVAMTSGLGGVTIAGAAEAAGVSVGLVQHYYASKDDLLEDTLSDVRRAALTRIDVATARAEKKSARIEQMMVTGLSQMLPLDKRRREEVYLTQAFAGLALENERLRVYLRQSDKELTRRVTTALENGKECGEVPGTTESAGAGYTLTALTSGLAARLLVTGSPRLERNWALSALAERASQLCPGRCSHHAAPA